MSTFVLMKILESSPERYDAGIWLLTLGAIASSYDRLAENVHPGQRVLDIGCGTGALAMRGAERGAMVKAMDINPHMLGKRLMHPKVSAATTENMRLAVSFLFIRLKKAVQSLSIVQARAE